jgi:hypothetical protein
VKRFLGVFALATVGVGLAVLAIDLGLRILYPHVPIITTDPRVGTLLRPNLSVRQAFGGHERVVTVRTNAFGLRGAELPRAKPDGTRRVLALGDSFTFGDAVQSEEAWPSQLEQRLNGGATGPYEVINAGVGGYGTAHELLLSRLLVRTLQPDLVVLGLSVVNDVLDNLCIDEASYGPRANAPCFTLEGDHLVLAGPVASPARPRSATWTIPGARATEFFRGQIMRLTLSHPRVLDLARSVGLPVDLPYQPATIAGWYDDRYRERGWALTRRLLVEMRTELAAQDIPLLILVVPASVQAEEDGGAKKTILRRLGGERPAIRAFLADPARPETLIARFCADEKIACVDPLPALSVAGTKGQRAYYRLDQHWTPYAHGVAAELIATRLHEFGWDLGWRTPRGLNARAR